MIKIFLLLVKSSSTVSSLVEEFCATTDIIFFEDCNENRVVLVRFSRYIQNPFENPFELPLPPLKSGRSFQGIEIQDSWYELIVQEFWDSLGFVSGRGQH